MSAASTWTWQVRSRAELLFDTPWAWAVVAVAVLAAASLYGVMQGVVVLSPVEVVSALADAEHPMHRMLRDVRLPRLLCAVGVGTSLGIAGLLLQTAVRNPLADPGILGVTAGAGVGGLVLLLIFPERAAWMPVAAFVGGVASIAIVLVLSWTQDARVGPLRMVLSGVALQAILFAVIALLTFAYADRSPAFAGFTVGSLSGSGWSKAQMLLWPGVVGTALALVAIRPLDLLLLDDGSAGSLGVPVRAARFAAACVAALLTAGAVSVAGLVGFVGLVVPNAMRLLVGPSHAKLLPISAIVGAALVVIADTIARTLLSPLELPVGAFLSLVGGPYFLFLIWKNL